MSVYHTATDMHLRYRSVRGANAWVTHSRMSMPDDYGFNPAVTVVNRNNP